MAKTIAKLAQLRTQIPALQYGDYRQLYVNHEQFAFMRTTPDQQVIVAVNSASEAKTIHLTDLPHGARWINSFNQAEVISHGGMMSITIPPNWGSILVNG